MTVRVSKPEFNLREKLSELDKPVGLKGSELLKSETAQDARNLVGAGRRNIIINGDFRIAQRATTHNSSGYRTVDRFKMGASGANTTLTQSQHTLSSSDAPYSEGFRHSFHIQNAGQSGNNQGYVIITYNTEAQDMAYSGWNYTSDSDYLTLSFWVKSSITHTFLFTFYTADGTPQDYNVLFPVQADTWKKIIVTVPGDPDITFDTNNDYGLQLMWNPYMGSHYTSGSSVNKWQNHAGYTSRPDMDDKWWKTASTFEITGIQLEVGPNATEFEHRNYGEELARCKRYYNKVYDVEQQSGEKPFLLGTYLNNSELACVVQFPKMRVIPTLDITNGTSKFMIRRSSVSDHFDTLTMRYGTTTTAELYTSSGVSGTQGECGIIRGAASDTYIAFDAELS